MVLKIKTIFIRGLIVLAAMTLLVTVTQAATISTGFFAAHDDLLGGVAGHGHASHTTWVGTTPPAVPTNVDWFLHNHSGTDSISVSQEARIRDAAGVWTSSGADLSLTEVSTDAAADIHVHGDATSGCGGGGVIACAEFAAFSAHNSSGYADGDPQHRMAGNSFTCSGPFCQELTMYTRSDWYSGASAGGIVGGQLDYMSVAIQEFGHLLGLLHNDSTTGHPFSEYSISPMNGLLSSGVTRRVLVASDTTAITHLYGASAVPIPSALLLFSSGLFGLGALKARWRSSKA